MPIERRRALRSVARDVTSTPSKCTLPPLGSSSRLMQRSSVLLPEPEGPMMKTSSRSLTREVDALENLGRAEALPQAGRW